MIYFSVITILKSRYYEKKEGLYFLLYRANIPVGITPNFGHHRIPKERVWIRFQKREFGLDSKLCDKLLEELNSQFLF